jgi:uncharacterized protein (DUF305 family)
MLSRSGIFMAQRVFILIVIAAFGAACRTAGGATASPAPPPQAGTQEGSADAAPQIVQPGAPGKAARVIAVDQATDLSRVQHTAADVKFMQGMIGHHQQAIEMTNLLKTRTASEDMKKLALRIDVSQEDEINMMKRWLEVRGQEIPSEHAMHMHGATLMPGMLTQEEMDKLAAAKGVEFDRLFLEGMIKHHGGALTMVKELFATPGAGQEAEIFAFASDVDADQRAEIDRMRSMLKEYQQ